MSIVKSYTSFSQNIFWADSCKSSSFVGNTIGINNSSFEKVVEMSNGDIVAAGKMIDKTSFVEKIYVLIIRFDFAGRIIWGKKIGTTNSSVANKNTLGGLAACSNGDVGIIINNKLQSGFQNVIFRFDAIGNLIWQKKIPTSLFSPSYEYFSDVVATTDNGFFIGGKTESPFNHQDAAVFRKIDANGNSNWNNIWYDDPHFINIKAVTETDSAYCFTGMFRDFQRNYIQNFLAAFNKSNGNFRWLRLYDFTNGLGAPLQNTEFAFSSLSYQNHVITMSGFTNPLYTGTNRNCQIVMNLDDTGQIISLQKMESLDITIDRYNDTMRCFYNAPYKMGMFYKYADTSDVYVYKQNPVWSNRVPLNDIQVPNDCIATKDSGFLIAGKTVIQGIGESGTLLKLSSNGLLESCNTIAKPMVIIGVPTILTQFNEGINTSPNFYESLTDASIELNDVLINSWQYSCSKSRYAFLSKIQGQSVLCNDSTYLFYAKRIGNNNPINFSCGGNNVITIVNDTAIKIKFLSEGTFTLYANLNSECGVLRDSLLITVKKKGTAFSLGSDKNICPNNTLVLHASSDYVTYLWQDNSTDSIYNVHDAGTYYVIATDACGNILKDTINIFSELPFSFYVGNDRTKCNEDTLHFEEPVSYSNYNWQPNYNLTFLSANQVIANPLLDTTYYITAEKYAGCKVFDTIKVIVLHSNKIDLGTDKIICEDSTVMLDAGNGFNKYLWSNNVGTQKIYVKQQGVYSVTATAANGCTSKDTIQVITKKCFNDLYFPTAFTPNKDGLNDVYKPITSRILTQYKFTVFNRFGEKVFETTDISKGWDGRFKGLVSDICSYVWMCSYQFQGEKEPRFAKGTLTLLK